MRLAILVLLLSPGFTMALDPSDFQLLQKKETRLDMASFMSLPPRELGRTAPVGWHWEVLDGKEYLVKNATAPGVAVSNNFPTPDCGCQGSQPCPCSSPCLCQARPIAPTTTPITAATTAVTNPHRELVRGSFGGIGPTGRTFTIAPLAAGGGTINGCSSGG